MDITTLIVINGHQCEVFIPEVPDIRVLKENNCSDWEGWYNGIKYFENKNRKPIYDQFTHLCLINSSAIGPIYEDGLVRHWLDPFFDKMKDTNSVACSPCINLLPHFDLGGYGKKLVPIFTLIKINEEIIRLLTREKITNVCETCINQAEQKTQNSILGFKTDKKDAILTGEYGLSRILLKNNYNICSILEGTSYIKIDLYNKNVKSLESTVFIKNVWRDGDTYSSPPVLYDYCMLFINNKLKYTNLFTNTSNIDYKLINKHENGEISNSYWSCDSITYNYKKWNTKKDFYELFGYSEELIVFPEITKNNTSCVIYTHYDKDNIIKDYVIQSIKTLMMLGYDIFFCTTSTHINNIDNLPFTINYFKNKGTDFFIIHDFLCSNLNKLKKYEWILFTNDSLILATHGIENMKNSIEKQRTNCDFWGIWESNEINIHLVSSLIEYNVKMLDIIFNFYNNVIYNCKSKDDTILKIEVKQTLHYITNGYKYNKIISYTDLKKVSHCVIFHPENIHSWINNKECFSIKWKYMINYIKFNEINNKYINSLLRYIKIGNTVPNVYNLF